MEACPECKDVSHPNENTTSTSMDAVVWLYEVVSTHPSKPSVQLERFLSYKKAVMTENVVDRAQIILEAIIPSIILEEQLQTDNIWANERRIVALKLYFRVLEAICTAGAQSFHPDELDTLLSNEWFHRSMLACSAELVLTTYKTDTVLFPLLLARTGITAFDLTKVIEIFIKHEESLPRELTEHLNALEARLMESMVWEKGSSMYEYLNFARPDLSSEIYNRGLLPEPLPSLDQIAMINNIFSRSLSPLPYSKKHEFSRGQNGEFCSPKEQNSSTLLETNLLWAPKPKSDGRLIDVKPSKNLRTKFSSVPLQSLFSSLDLPIPGGDGETCAETVISVFFSKISKLAAVKINVLADSLQLSQNVRDLVYCLIQKILSQRTVLFFNRHIDQIILCSFYGVAKVSQLKLTFKEIVGNVRKQQNWKPEIFQRVFVGPPATWGSLEKGKEYVDIITFYNEIFCPAVRHLLMSLVPAGSVGKARPLKKSNVDGQSSGLRNVYLSLPRSLKRISLRGGLGAI